MSGRPVSTLGHERIADPYLDRPSAARRSSSGCWRTSPFPGYYRRMKELNSAGPPLLGELPGKAAVPAEDFHRRVTGDERWCSTCATPPRSAAATCRARSASAAPRTCRPGRRGRCPTAGRSCWSPRAPRRWKRRCAPWCGWGSTGRGVPRRRIEAWTGAGYDAAGCRSGRRPGSARRLASPAPSSSTCGRRPSGGPATSTGAPHPRLRDREAARRGTGRRRRPAAPSSSAAATAPP